jgi:hypothetical protein
MGIRPDEPINAGPVNQENLAAIGSLPKIRP